MQRAKGELCVRVKVRGGGTVLQNLRQSGSLKARLPRPEQGAWTTLVTLNSSGGIAGGDQLNTRIEVAPQCKLTVTSQSAERLYRAGDWFSPAEIQTVLEVEDDGELEWLPQETILFDGCALRRNLDIRLTGTARFLGVEVLLFGRTLMGETVNYGRLHDTVRLTRNARLVWHDAIRLDGAIQAVMNRPATANGGRAMAILLLASRDAARWLDALRAALTPFDAGVSLMDDLLVARIIARNGSCARAAIVAGLATLRASRPLPRVWSC